MSNTMTAAFTHVVCLECGCEMPADVMAAACPNCGSNWLDARYDYPAVAAAWSQPAGLERRDHSLWRYAELLPLNEPDPEISMGEGYTSLIRLYQYERIYDHQHIYIKDERQGPTSSFKDRQAALAVTAMRRAGIRECVLASTGNAAAAYAAYCARAGIRLWLFLTSLVPAEKMREAALYGAEVIKVSGTYDETKHVAAEFARRKGIYLDRGAKAIPGKESMKTLAFEIAEQLALKLGTDGRWAAPDWYIQAVSGGIGPLGVSKGFSELYQMGLIDRIPKLGIVQAAGCAPMVQAYAAGKAQADAVVPKTLITVLATGDPGFSYVQLRETMQMYGGAMIAVEDGDTFDAMRQLASKAGFSVEPATAVAFAGLARMLKDGTIAPDETVVVNLSGHTFPAESHILGDQYVLNLELSANAGTEVQHEQEEGLGAALRRLDEQVTTIVVVDDNPNDRRLVRRLLQRYKRYRVYEARNGAEALEVIAERNPDLVVTDLTMPEMDGFSLLERMKSNPQMANIPVVVVSAKSLTGQDREFLTEYSESVWVKGGLDTYQLVDHIVTTLGDEPVLVSRPRRSASTVSQPDMTDSISDLPSIVIIDDNPDDLRLTRRALERTGRYRVLSASTGRDGLKMIYEYRPDAIVLDLVLPDMDGFAVLRALQSDEALREIPVIVVTAKELSAEDVELLSEQTQSRITKSSFDRQQFLTIVEKSLSYD